MTRFRVCVVALLAMATVTTTGHAADDFVLRRARVWSAAPNARGVDADTDVLVRAGRIAAVGSALKVPAGTREIDARGTWVTPGIVDAHSHLGVFAAPASRAHDDGNEWTNPLTPFVRAIDGFDHEDPAIRRAVEGGVTTAQILPGSANVIGGQAFLMKLRGGPVSRLRIEGAPLSLKMAMGENPKRSYGSKGQMPMTRMGNAHVLRQAFVKARRALEDYKAWELKKEGKPPRMEPDLEPLAALLDGRARLHIHCYEAHDIETIVRISHEMGFKVAAIHHALEAWKVPELLKHEGIAVVTFADLWGFKLEAWDASVRGPAILHRAGVRVVLKSDHPVIEARHLVHEAAKAWNHGLDRDEALRAVTLNAASVLGLEARIGSVEVGKDADLVVWPDDPFRVGVLPLRVFIEGEEVVTP